MDGNTITSVEVAFDTSDTIVENCGSSVTLNMGKKGSAKKPSNTCAKKAPTSKIAQSHDLEDTDEDVILPVEGSDDDPYCDESIHLAIVAQSSNKKEEDIKYQCKERSTFHKIALVITDYFLKNHKVLQNRVVHSPEEVVHKPKQSGAQPKTGWWCTAQNQAVRPKQGGSAQPNMVGWCTAQNGLVHCPKPGGAQPKTGKCTA